MKNKVLILLFAIGGLVSSCSDAYDIPEKGTLYNEYEAFRNAEDVKRGLNVIYLSVPTSTEIALGSIFTDEVAIGPDNGGQGLISGEYSFFMESNNAYAASIWNSYYAMINRINRLEVISKKFINDASGNTVEINNHKNNLAELYALRAYAHYKLFAYFTPNYTNASGKSAIILDHVPPLDYSYSLPRNSVSEVKKFILDDLQRAEENRSAGWAGMEYANGDMVNAIRVKLFSMTEEWDNVLTYGQAIMDKYSLEEPQKYRDIFGKEPVIASNKEVIFMTKVTPNSGPSVIGNWYSVRTSAGGSPFYKMGRSLYNEFDKLDSSKTGTLFPGQQEGNVTGQERNDVRFAVNLLDKDEDPVNPTDTDTQDGSTVLLNYETASQSDYNAKDVLLIGKYMGIPQASLKGNLFLFRTADILLAMAEARAAKGQFSSGATDPDDLVNDFSNVYSILYTIRYNRSIDRTVTLPTITTQQSAWKAILDERRVEFAFEGHRYLDMKRIGAKANSNGFTRYSKDCFVNGACNLPVSDYRMTLPIPVTEMNGNNSLTTDSQNPGYN